MFRRLLIEEWQHALTIASFAIFFTSFLMILIRLWRMPHPKVEHLERLPLEGDSHD